MIARMIPRLQEAALRVMVALPGDEVRALGPFRFEVAEIEERCTWATVRKDGTVTVKPEAARLSDRALADLIAHELAHLAVYGSGGWLSAEEAAWKRAASWGFEEGGLRQEIRAIRLAEGKGR